MYKANSGFSLLEVLVAFVILAMALGVLMQIFSGGLRNANRSSEYQQAVLLAQSKLDSVGIELPLEPGSLEGVFDDTYRWQVSIRPYVPDQEEAAAAPVRLLAVNPLILLIVDVRVFWGHVGLQRVFKLTTLRLANRGSL